MTFSHLKKNKISMVDISKKKLTNRTAMATLCINFSEKNTPRKLLKKFPIAQIVINFMTCRNL